MKKHSDGQGGVPVQRSGRSNGFIPTSFRALSSYLRIVSSGASTVARSAASVASSIVDRDGDSTHDQMLWAGYDKLQCESGATRQVLLLGYRSGFQVWDVEEPDNVRQLISKHDGPVSFMQMLLKPIGFKRSTDKFADSRPLLVISADGSSSGGFNDQHGSVAPNTGSLPNLHDPGNVSFLPTTVRFYSYRSQSYVHVLKFRSVVYSVRCSSRVVAILQSSQIHCFDASTLVKEYTILTNPIASSGVGSGGLGYGPLAVGPRWLAYSGRRVVVSNSGRVSPQDLTPSSVPGFSSNESIVAHYAKESSKQLASGIATLGDAGYKKLSRYYSELRPEGNDSNGVANGHLLDADSVGMVIVRDIVSKGVIAQFRAHKSPISALCFDFSGTLLVTASVQGHNINVFKIMSGPSTSSSASEGGASCVHLYRLQRGFTNAVIQDIGFSEDSNWIMISSSRGTCHMFAINPSGGSVNLHSADSNFGAKSSGSGVVRKSTVRWLPNSVSQTSSQQSLCMSGPPVTLSVVSRIRNGNTGWRGTVSGVAAAATGRTGSLSGVIASSFLNSKGNYLYNDRSSSRSKYHLLVFSPSGCMIQYVLRISADNIDPPTVAPRLNGSYGSAQDSDGRLVVEAIRKWNICQKQNRTERDDIDIYGDNGNLDSNKIYPEGVHDGMGVYPEAGCRVTKAKVSPEEKQQHLYISEAELQMHQAHVPLWISFQSMKIEGIKTDADIASGGEIEIERIPTRMIEARSRDLVPVFDFLQTPKFQQERISSLDGTATNGRLVHHSRSGLSENGRFSRRSSSGSLDRLIDGGSAVAQVQNVTAEGTGWDGPLIPARTEGFVNSNKSPKSMLRDEVVNNRDRKMETQPNFVHNNREGLKLEKHFEDEHDEFD